VQSTGNFGAAPAAHSAADGAFAGRDAMAAAAPARGPLHYRARVALTETQFRNPPPGFALRPGVRLVADIKVGRRSILDSVLNPPTRVVGESLREP
jgi:hemolysin D